MKGVKGSLEPWFLRCIAVGFTHISVPRENQPQEGNVTKHWSIYKRGGKIKTRVSILHLGVKTRIPDPLVQTFRSGLVLGTPPWSQQSPGWSLNASSDTTCRGSGRWKSFVFSLTQPASVRVGSHVTLLHLKENTVCLLNKFWVLIEPRLENFLFWSVVLTAFILRSWVQNPVGESDFIESLRNWPSHKTLKGHWSDTLS